MALFFRKKITIALLCLVSGLLLSVASVSSEYNSVADIKAKQSRHHVLSSDWNATEEAELPQAGRFGSFRIQRPESELFVGGLAEQWQQVLSLSTDGKLLQNFASQQVRSKIIEDRFTIDFKEWLSAQRKNTWQRLVQKSVDYTSHYLVSASEDELQSYSFIRNINWDYQSALGTRKWQSGLSALGALREGDNDAVVWQLRAYAAEDSSVGGNAGIIYRRFADAAGESLLGVNAFLDYEQYGDEEQSFWRWSLGGEYRSNYVDLFANRYLPITEARTTNGYVYTQGGYDVAVELHAPDLPWGLSGGLTYYRWLGENGDADEKGLRYHLQVEPQSAGVSGLRIKVELDAATGGDVDWGGAISYHHQLGAPSAADRSAVASGFDARAHFFDPVRREYSQRIRRSETGDSEVLASISKGSAELYFESTTVTLSVGDGGTVEYPFAPEQTVTVVTKLTTTLGLYAANWRATIHENSTIALLEQGSLMHVVTGTVDIDRSGNGLDAVYIGNVTVHLLGTQVRLGRSFSSTHDSALSLSEGVVSLVVVATNQISVQVSGTSATILLVQDFPGVSLKQLTLGCANAAQRNDGKIFNSGYTGCDKDAYLVNIPDGETVSLSTPEGEELAVVGQGTSLLSVVGYSKEWQRYPFALPGVVLRAGAGADVSLHYDSATVSIAAASTVRFANGENDYVYALLSGGSISEIGSDSVSCPGNSVAEEGLLKVVATCGGISLGVTSTLVMSVRQGRTVVQTVTLSGGDGNYNFEWLTRPGEELQLHADSGNEIVLSLLSQRTITKDTYSLRITPSNTLLAGYIAPVTLAINVVVVSLFTFIAPESPAAIFRSEIDNNINLYTLQVTGAIAPASVVYPSTSISPASVSAHFALLTVAGAAVISLQTPIANALEVSMVIVAGDTVDDPDTAAYSTVTVQLSARQPGDLVATYQRSGSAATNGYAVHNTDYRDNLAIISGVENSGALSGLLSGERYQYTLSSALFIVQSNSNAEATVRVIPGLATLPAGEYIITAHINDNHSATPEKQLLISVEFVTPIIVDPTSYATEVNAQATNYAIATVTALLGKTDAQNAYRYAIGVIEPPLVNNAFSIADNGIVTFNGNSAINQNVIATVNIAVDDFLTDTANYLLQVTVYAPLNAAAPAVQNVHQNNTGVFYTPSNIIQGGKPSYTYQLIAVNTGYSVSDFNINSASGAVNLAAVLNSGGQAVLEIQVTDGIGAQVSYQLTVNISDTALAWVEQSATVTVRTTDSGAAYTVTASWTTEAAGAITYNLLSTAPINKPLLVNSSNGVLNIDTALGSAQAVSAYIVAHSDALLGVADITAVVALDAQTPIYFATTAITVTATTRFATSLFTVQAAGGVDGYTYIIHAINATGDIRAGDIALNNNTLNLAQGIGAQTFSVVLRATDDFFKDTALMTVAVVLQVPPALGLTATNIDLIHITDTAGKVADLQASGGDAGGGYVFSLLPATNNYFAINQSAANAVLSLTAAVANPEIFTVTVLLDDTHIDTSAVTQLFTVEVLDGLDANLAQWFSTLTLGATRAFASMAVQNVLGNATYAIVGSDAANFNLSDDNLLSLVIAASSPKTLVAEIEVRDSGDNTQLVVVSATLALLASTAFTPDDQIALAATTLATVVAPGTGSEITEISASGGYVAGGGYSYQLLPAPLFVLSNSTPPVLSAQSALAVGTLAVTIRATDATPENSSDIVISVVVLPTLAASVENISSTVTAGYQGRVAEIIAVGGNPQPAYLYSSDNPLFAVAANGAVELTAVAINSNGNNILVEEITVKVKYSADSNEEVNVAFTVNILPPFIFNGATTQLLISNNLSSTIATPAASGGGGSYNYVLVSTAPASLESQIELNAAGELLVTVAIAAILDGTIYIEATDTHLANSEVLTAQFILRVREGGSVEVVPYWQSMRSGDARVMASVNVLYSQSPHTVSIVAGDSEIVLTADNELQVNSASNATAVTLSAKIQLADSTPSTVEVMYFVTVYAADDANYTPPYQIVPTYNAVQTVLSENNNNIVLGNLSASGGIRIGAAALYTYSSATPGFTVNASDEVLLTQNLTAGAVAFTINVSAAAESATHTATVSVVVPVFFAPSAVTQSIYNDSNGVVFTLSASGGNGAYTYNVEDNLEAALSALQIINNNVISINPLPVGVYSVTLQVSDALLDTAVYTLHLQSHQPPTLAGGSTLLAATVSGAIATLTASDGIGNFSYKLLTVSDSRLTLVADVLQLTAPLGYEADVTVSLQAADATGRTSTAEWNVTTPVQIYFATTAFTVTATTRLTAQLLTVQAAGGVGDYSYIINAVNSTGNIATASFALNGNTLNLVQGIIGVQNISVLIRATDDFLDATIMTVVVELQTPPPLGLTATNIDLIHITDTAGKVADLQASGGVAGGGYVFSLLPAINDYFAISQSAANAVLSLTASVASAETFTVTVLLDDTHADTPAVMQLFTVSVLEGLDANLAQWFSTLTLGATRAFASLAVQNVRGNATYTIVGSDAANFALSDDNLLSLVIAATSPTILVAEIEVGDSGDSTQLVVVSATLELLAATAFTPDDQIALTATTLATVVAPGTGSEITEIVASGGYVAGGGYSYQLLPAPLFVLSNSTPPVLSAQSALAVGTLAVTIRATDATPENSSDIVISVVVLPTLAASVENISATVTTAYQGQVAEIVAVGGNPQPAYLYSSDNPLFAVAANGAVEFVAPAVNNGSNILVEEITVKVKYSADSNEEVNVAFTVNILPPFIFNGTTTQLLISNNLSSTIASPAASGGGGSYNYVLVSTAPASLESQIELNVADELLVTAAITATLDGTIYIEATDTHLANSEALTAQFILRVREGGSVEVVPYWQSMRSGDARVMASVNVLYSQTPHTLSIEGDSEIVLTADNELQVNSASNATAVTLSAKIQLADSTPSTVEVMYFVTVYAADDASYTPPYQIVPAYNAVQAVLSENSNNIVLGNLSASGGIRIGAAALYTYSSATPGFTVNASDEVLLTQNLTAGAVAFTINVSTAAESATHTATVSVVVPVFFAPSAVTQNIYNDSNGVVFTLSASGGNGAYTYNVENNLEAALTGLQIINNNVISINPLPVGVYSVTLQVRDALLDTAVYTLHLQSHQPPTLAGGSTLLAATVSGAIATLAASDGIGNFSYELLTVSDSKLTLVADVLQLTAPLGYEADVTVSLQAIDATGRTSTAEWNVTTPVQIYFATTEITVTATTRLTAPLLTVQAGGGVGDYSYIINAVNSTGNVATASFALSGNTLNLVQGIIGVQNISVLIRATDNFLDATTMTVVVELQTPPTLGLTATNIDLIHITDTAGKVADLQASGGDAGGGYIFSLLPATNNYFAISQSSANAVLSLTASVASAETFTVTVLLDDTHADTSAVTQLFTVEVLEGLDANAVQWFSTLTLGATRAFASVAVQNVRGNPTYTIVGSDAANFALSDDNLLSLVIAASSPKTLVAEIEVRDSGDNTQLVVVSATLALLASTAFTPDDQIALTATTLVTVVAPGTGSEITEIVASGGYVAGGDYSYQLLPAPLFVLSNSTPPVLSAQSALAVGTLSVTIRVTDATPENSSDIVISVVVLPTLAASVENINSTVTAGYRGRVAEIVAVGGNPQPAYLYSSDNPSFTVAADGAVELTAVAINSNGNNILVEEITVKVKYSADSNEEVNVAFTVNILPPFIFNGATTQLLLSNNLSSTIATPAASGGGGSYNYVLVSTALASLESQIDLNAADELLVTAAIAAILDGTIYIEATDTHLANSEVLTAQFILRVREGGSVEVVPYWQSMRSGDARVMASVNVLYSQTPHTLSIVAGDSEIVLTADNELQVNSASNATAVTLSTKIQLADSTPSTVEVMYFVTVYAADDANYTPPYQIVPTYNAVQTVLSENNNNIVLGNLSASGGIRIGAAAVYTYSSATPGFTVNASDEVLLTQNLTAGAVAFTINVSAAAESATHTATVSVVVPVFFAPSAVTQNIYNDSNGVVFTLSASGGNGAYTYSVENNLEAALSALQIINSSEISINALPVGVYSVTLQVSDALLDSAVYTLHLQSHQPPTLAGGSTLLAATVSGAIATLAASDGIGNFSYELLTVSDSKLTLVADVLQLTAPLGYEADVTISLQAADATGRTSTAEWNVTTPVQIYFATTAFTVTATTRLTAQLLTVQAAGGVGDYSYIISAVNSTGNVATASFALSGNTLNLVQGIIGVQNISVLIRATDDFLDATTMTVVVELQTPPPLELTATTIDLIHTTDTAGKVADLQASGGVAGGGYAFSLLPATNDYFAISQSAANAVLSLTASVASAETFTVTVLLDDTHADTPAVTQLFTVSVLEGLDANLAQWFSTLTLGATRAFASVAVQNVRGTPTYTIVGSDAANFALSDDNLLSLVIAASSPKTLVAEIEVRDSGDNTQLVVVSATLALLASTAFTPDDQIALTATTLVTVVAPGTGSEITEIVASGGYVAGGDYSYQLLSAPLFVLSNSTPPVLSAQSALAVGTLAVTIRATDATPENSSDIVVSVVVLPTLAASVQNISSTVTAGYQGRVAEIVAVGGNPQPAYLYSSDNSSFTVAADGAVELTVAAINSNGNNILVEEVTVKVKYNATSEEATVAFTVNILPPFIFNGTTTQLLISNNLSSTIATPAASGGGGSYNYVLISTAPASLESYIELNAADELLVTAAIAAILDGTIYIEATDTHLANSEVLTAQFILRVREGGSVEVVPYWQSMRSGDTRVMASVNVLYSQTPHTVSIVAGDSEIVLTADNELQVNSASNATAVTLSTKIQLADSTPSTVEVMYFVTVYAADDASYTPPYQIEPAYNAVQAVLSENSNNIVLGNLSASGGIRIGAATVYTYSSATPGFTVNASDEVLLTQNLTAGAVAFTINVSTAAESATHTATVSVVVPVFFAPSAVTQSIYNDSNGAVFTLSASGGNGAYTYNVEDNLEAALSALQIINSVISINPLPVGIYSVTLQVRDALLDTAVYTLHLQSHQPPTLAGGSTLLAATVSGAIATLAASGGIGNVSYELLTVSDSRLTLVADVLQLTVSLGYDLTITATIQAADATGRTSTAEWNVATPPALVAQELNLLYWVAPRDIGITAQISVGGGEAPYQVTLLTHADVVSITVVSAGEAYFVELVENGLINAIGVGESASVSIQLTDALGNNLLTVQEINIIAPIALSGITLQRDNSTITGAIYTFAASGGNDENYSYDLVAVTPASLSVLVSLDNTSGVLSQVSVAVSGQTVTLAIATSDGVTSATATAVVGWRVLEWRAGDADVNWRYTDTGAVYTLAAVGGDGSYSYAFVVPPLESALSLQSDGVLLITAALGQYRDLTVSVQASDGDGAQVTAMVRIVATDGVDLTDGGIYLMGGQNSPNSIGGVFASSDSQQWLQIATANEVIFNRDEHAAVAHKGSVFIIAGIKGENQRADVWASANGSDWQQKTSNAFPARADHAAVSYNGTIYVIGGNGPGNIAYDDVWASADGDNWQLVTMGAFSARLGHALLVHENTLYVVGGLTAEGGFLEDVWASTDGITWQARTQDAQMGGVAQNVVLSHQGNMYLIGGRFNGEVLSDKVWMSANNGRDWQQIIQNAPFPGRWGHVGWERNNKFYINGGLATDNNYEAIWSSADAANWSIDTSTPGFGSRVHHAVAVLNEMPASLPPVYLEGATLTLFADETATHTLQATGGNKTYHYQLIDNTLAAVEIINGNQLALSQPIAAVVSVTARVTDGNGASADALYIFDSPPPPLYGGVYAIGGGNNKNDVYTSLDGALWTLLIENAEFLGRKNHQALAHNGSLYVIGGFGNGKTYADVWSSAEGKRWKRLAESAFPVRENHGAVSYRGSLYVIGGRSGSTKYNDVWVSEHGVQWQPLIPQGDLFSARDGHAVVAHRGEIVLMGGEANGAAAQSDIWTSRNGTDWTGRSLPANLRRYTHVLLSHNSTLYMIGGQSGSGILSDVWASATGENWNNLSNSTINPFQQHTGFVLNNKLFTYGNALNIWSSEHGVNWSALALSPPSVGQRNGHVAVVLQKKPLNLADGSITVAAAASGAIHTLTVTDGSGNITYSQQDSGDNRITVSESGVFYINSNASLGYDAVVTVIVKAMDEDGREHVAYWYVRTYSPLALEATDDLYWFAPHDATNITVLQKITGGVPPYQLSSTLPLAYQNNVSVALVTVDGQHYSRLVDSGLVSNLGTGSITLQLQITDATGDVLNTTEIIHVVDVERAVYLIGGEINGTPSNEVLISPDSKLWLTIAATAEFSPRSGHAAVAHNGSIYVIGGKSNIGGDTSYSDIWVSKFGRNWQQLANNAFPVRSGHSALSYKGTLYVIGGFKDSSNTYNEVWASSTGVNWSIVSSGVLPNLYQHVAVVHSNIMYTIGGNGVDEVWASTNGKDWTQKTAALPAGNTYEHAAVSFLGSIYMIGGYDFRNEVWASEEGSNWQNINSSGLPGLREHVAWVQNTVIYINGGFTADNNPEAILKSTDGINWSVDTATSGFVGRRNHAVIVVGDDLAQIVLADGVVSVASDFSGDAATVQASGGSGNITYELLGSSDGRVTVATDGVVRVTSSLGNDVSVLLTIRARDESGATQTAIWQVVSGSDKTTVPFMYVIGGDDGERKNDVWRSSYGADWTVVATAGFSERDDHAAVVYDNDLYVIGGYDDVGAKNDVWQSDDGVTWTKLEDAPFSPRYDHIAVELNNTLFIIAGYDNSGATSDVWSYNGTSWQLQEAAAFPARYSHSALVQNGTIFVIGGIGGRQLFGQLFSDVWASTDGSSWTQLAVSAGFTPRSGAAAVAQGGTLYVIGGWDGGYKNDVWTSVDGVTWQRQTAAAVFSRRYSHAALSFGGNLYVIGGYDGDNKNDVWTSANGVTWTQTPLNDSTRFSARTWHAALAYPVVDFNQIVLADGVVSVASDFIGDAATVQASGGIGNITYELLSSSDGRVTVAADGVVRVTSSLGNDVSVFLTIRARDESGATDTATWRVESDKIVLADGVVSVASDFSGNAATVQASGGSGNITYELLGSSDGRVTVAADGVVRVISPLGNDVNVFLTIRARDESGATDTATWRVESDKIALADGVVSVASDFIGNAATVQVSGGIGNITYELLSSSDGRVTFADDGVVRVTSPLGRDVYVTLVIRVRDESGGAAKTVTLRVESDKTSAMYVIGGYDGARKNDVWRSSDGADWTFVATAEFSGRRDHAAVVYDNDFYVIGGFDVNNNRKNDVWQSDDGVAWNELAVAPFSARAEHVAVTLNNTLFIIAGYDDNGATNDVWSYNGTSWQLQTAVAFPARYRHSALVQNGTIFVIGGRSANAQHLSDVWASTNGSVWTQLTVSAGFTPRQDAAVVAQGGTLYVIGGYDDFLHSGGGHKNDVWTSVDGVTWQEQTAAAAFSGRDDHAVLSFAGKLYVIGGDNTVLGTESFKNDVWESADGITWTQTPLNSSKRFSARAFHAALVK